MGVVLPDSPLLRNAMAMPLMSLSKIAVDTGAIGRNPSRNLMYSGHPFLIVAAEM